MKFYRIFGTMRYQFGGFDDVIILVKKETETQIIGLSISNGNFTRMDLEESLKGDWDFRKIVINKHQIAGWEEIV